ncbi:MAG: Crp/Fnr family transcriptional regulator [Bacteroidota bacterium]
MKEIQLEKGTILQRKGDPCRNVYLVKSGLLRSYSIDSKGKEHIFMFAPEGWIVADNALPEEPCELFIDALEDSIVERSDKIENIDMLEGPKLVKRIRVLQKRIIMLMSASALERYDHFLETYPDIVKRVPQKMIASYLGITPEALSTIKRKRLRDQQNK